MIKRILTIFYVLILFSCYCSDEINKERKIVHGIFSKPFTLDPSKINDKVTGNIIPQIFETLVSLDRHNISVIPKLAENWEISENGLSYNFYLKPNVKFHDGSYLTGEDVKISFLRQYDSICPYYYDNPPNIYENLLKGVISSIDILDSFTVRINLKYSNSLFLYIISSPFIVPIVSSKSLRKNIKEFGEHPIGTGPFKLQNKSLKDEIILIPFENYWGEIPSLKELEFKIGRADELENKALESSIDILSRISGNNIERFIDSKKFDFLTTEPETIYFLGFNMNRIIIKNRKLREAMLLSLDKKRIVFTINRTNADIADGPLPKGIFNSNNFVKQEDYNLEKAKEIIKEFEDNIPKLKLIGFTDYPRTKVFFDIIVNYLTQIGIEIEKNYCTEWEIFENEKRLGDYDLILDGWGADILGDPYFFLYNLFHSNSNFNVFRYKNEKVDKLLEEAVRTFDKDKRYKLYEEINNIIIEDIPAVFISQIKDVFVVNKRIKNVIINPYRYIECKNVIIN